MIVECVKFCKIFFKYFFEDFMINFVANCIEVFMINKVLFFKIIIIIIIIIIVIITRFISKILFYIIIWQGSPEVNQGVLIRSFLAVILPYGPFVISRVFWPERRAISRGILALRPSLSREFCPEIGAIFPGTAFVPGW